MNNKNLAPKLTYLRQLYALWQLTQTSELYRLSHKTTSLYIDISLLPCRSSIETVLDQSQRNNALCFIKT